MKMWFYPFELSSPILIFVSNYPFNAHFQNFLYNIYGICYI